MRHALFRLARTAVAVTAATVGLAALAHDDARKHKPPKEPVTVKIIGFNDYHGNLESPGTFGANTTIPVANRPAVGGAEFMAAAVTRMKEGNRNNVVVGAGDFIGATPLISALFFDEPAVETLNKNGPRVQRRRQPRVRPWLGRVEAAAARRLQAH